MFSFVIKSLLRGDIVADDCWFQNSSEICEYRLSRCDSPVSYVNLNARKFDGKQSNKEDFKIKGSMTQHIFEYLLHSKAVYNREYLLKWEECINLIFSSCLEESEGVDLDKTDKEVAIIENTEAGVKNDCELDNNDNDATRTYEFTDIPFYVLVITLSLSEPLYIIKYLRKAKFLR